MQYRILLVALEAELPYKKAPSNYKVIYTGVGKVNAAIATTRAIMEAHDLGFHPRVVNYGTAGSCRADLSGLHRVTRFVQRDMNAEPSAPRGVTPFEAGLPYLEFGADSIANPFTLGTGDSFVHAEDTWLTENNIDIVDMEGYAIAQVCKQMNVELTCMKYITDYVGTPHQFDVWEKNVSEGATAIMEFLND